MKQTTKGMMWNGERWGLYSDGYWRIGARYLHREKWEKLRGPIPEGWVVHHIDHDRSNAAIGNLQCMSKGAHSAHHMHDSEIHSAKNRRKATMTRSTIMHLTGPKISAAHLSREKITKACNHCGASFKARNTYASVCSATCASNQRYHSSKDKEKRDCVQCGKSFLANKYRHTTVCSRSCGTKRMHAERKLK